MTPPASQPHPTLPPRLQTLRPVQKPCVPDHEVMRCIGRGSYGEVWLARGVTGAWRAVKVVRREDFELDRTFEREFQGILSFEPVSRDHEGLVDILHVGRSLQEGFYFYVMELADDRETGSEVHVVDYEPHTLGVEKRLHAKLPLDQVVELGVSLADGLAHLHDRGLSHRDIKPSNIIFVQGKAKLADIGLVAREGQQTYVGTEGFVPPEGPGTKAADVFSLGMVLYEISTGMDRLSFPELPQDLGDNKQKRRHRMLNDVICKACDPNPRKRFSSAKQFADALRLVRKGRYHRPFLPKAVKLFCFSGILAFGMVWSRTQAFPWPPGAPAAKLGDVPRAVGPGRIAPTGSIRVDSDPPGAEIWSGNKLMGKTPATLAGLPLGATHFILKHDKYRPEPMDVHLEQVGNMPFVVSLQLAPPEQGRSWENSVGMKFLPSPNGDWHESETPVTYDQFLMLMRFAPADVVEGNAVRIPVEDAESFCLALYEKDFEAGRLEQDQHFYRPFPVAYEPTEPPVEQAEDHVVFKCILQKREFGELVIESNPPGAAIFYGDKKLGFTPITLPHHQTGPLEYTLRMLGYEDNKVTGNLDSKQRLQLHADLIRERQAILGVPHENSLGMRFQPLGPLLISVWETRVKDYDAFVNATDPANRHSVSWEQTPEHPVARLDRGQCQAFCKWLTTKERAEGLLAEDLEYRLPSDEEWSMAADLPERKRDAPADRNQGARANYIWGINIWPPPIEKEKMPGNFSDVSRLRLDSDGKPVDRDVKRELTLEKEKYDDGFVYTAPVGSFCPNKFGLYDLAGNVAEWVSDNYGGNLPDYGVTRGGSWADGKEANGKHPMLVASSRNAIKPDLKDSPYGFRCMIGAVKK